MDIKKLSNDELWNRTRELAAQERRITLEVIRHLREIEARGLHLNRGFPSLYEYAVRELKFSEGAAYRRVQAMRLIKDIPYAEKKIESGELTLTTISKVQNSWRKDPSLNKEELLQKLVGKSSREVDRELAPTQVVNREHTRWLTSEAVELTLILEKNSFKTLEDLKAIKSHAPEKSTYSGVVKELIDLGDQKWNPLRRIAPPSRRSSAPSLDPRHITPSLRAEVWKRDGARCSFKDPQSGKTCDSKYFLQVDHILPLALGGRSEVENLRLLCANHNQFRAKQTFQL